MRFQFDAVHNRFIKDIKAGVDSVSQEFLGLFNESRHSARLLLVSETMGMRLRCHYYNSILGRILNLSDHHSRLLSMSLVKLNHLQKWILADYVRVEYKEEWTLILCKDGLV
jgi:hypothetical protein